MPDDDLVLLREYAQSNSEEAFAALEPYGSRADGLKAVARYLVERKK